MSTIAKLDHSRRLRIPEEWGEEFTPWEEVELVRCEEGVLVKPLRNAALQVALQRKVMMKEPTHLDLGDVDMDAIGW